MLPNLERVKRISSCDFGSLLSLAVRYTSWCDEEANEKEDAITSSKRTIGDLEATIEDAEASIQSLTASIDELTSKISSSETELAEASGIREKEHAQSQRKETAQAQSRIRSPKPPESARVSPCLGTPPSPVTRRRTSRR